MQWALASLILVSLWANLETFPHKHRHRRTHFVSQPTEDIQFDLADLIVQTQTVNLEAYKVRRRQTNEISHWVSIGFPQLVNDSNGQIFHFTEEDISVDIRLLDEWQKNALVNKAKHKYRNRNINVTSEDIAPLPLSQFKCSITYIVNGTTSIAKGIVLDLQRSLVTLTFPLPRGTQARKSFEERIRDQSDPLRFVCVLAATGKQERIDNLRVTARHMEQMNLTADVLGSATEKYVVRNQLMQLAREIASGLRIEERYEIENEQFGEEFIKKILQDSNARFQTTPVGEALEKMSKYGIANDQRNLSPEEIKRELSNVIIIETTGNKEHLGASQNRYNVSSSLWNIIDLVALREFILEKSNQWLTGSSTVDDQLKELNRHTRDSVVWEKDGTKIIPKSVKVAKVTKATFGRQMSFDRIKEKIVNPRYYKELTLNTRQVGPSPGISYPICPTPLSRSTCPPCIQLTCPTSPASVSSTQPPFPVTVERLNMTFSHNGTVLGKHCIAINEPEDRPWGDNYLCFNKNYGVRWSHSGPIERMNCTQIYEYADLNSWNNNYLCVPIGNSWWFQWSPNGRMYGKSCILIHEPDDMDNWDNNYLCVVGLM